jgi:hypothetical protein
VEQASKLEMGLSGTGILPVLFSETTGFPACSTDIEES